MTTIEHLAIINLRLAQKCAKKDDFIESMKRTVAAHIAKSSKKQGEAESAAKYSMGCAERSEKARVAAEAKLADAERRLRDANNDRLYHCAYCGETGDMYAIADHSKVCAKHPMREVERQRDAEKARADALQTTEAEIRHLRNEVERLRNDYLTVADAVCRESKSPEDCARQARETRADNERLRGELAAEHAEGAVDADTIRTLKAEVERLRGIIREANGLLNRVSDLYVGPLKGAEFTDALDPIINEIEKSKQDREDAILREADAPPKRHLPADHKCVLCHGTGYYGDNGPGIKGNSEYQPCGCTMREADPPPAKPRDSTGRDASAVAAMLPPKPRRMKANPICRIAAEHAVEHDESSACGVGLPCEPVDAPPSNAGVLGPASAGK